MLKKTIKFVDFNNVERTEDHYFNLTKAEVMEMEMSTAGGLAEKIKKVVDAKDVPTIFKIFKEVVLKAYGVKSEDGRRFIKSEALKEEFAQTEAFSELIMELATDADAAAAFVNGIVPADMNKNQKAIN